MTMNDLLDALRAGLRCVLDGTLWRALAASASTWPVALRATGATILLLAAALLALVLPLLAIASLGFILGWWLVPLAVRRAGAVIAEHALAVEPALVIGPSLPLPEPRTYRREWLPALFCFTYLPRLVAAQDWGDDVAAVLLLLAMQAWVAPGAIVRTLLLPRFRRASIDESVAARHVYWGAVILPWLVVLTGVWRVQAWASIDSPAAVARLWEAWHGGAAGVEAALRIVAFVGVALVTGVFATAALARFSGAAMLRREGRLALRPELLPAAGNVAAPAPKSRPAESAPAPARPRAKAPGVIVLTLVALLAAGYAARAPLAYVVIDHDRLPEDVSLRAWLHPEVRAAAAWYSACHGDAANLRTMLSAGIVTDDFEHHDVLGCAAQNAHLDAVRALVDARYDVNALARPIDALANAAPLSPLQQALRTPAGVPVADYLLAHGASFRPNGPGAVDAAQVAAASGCLPCLDWLKRHAAPMDATTPATPLALWFDNPAQRDVDDDQSLADLLALGLSPTAVGADGRSALHAAAAAGNGAAVRLLLAKGADPALADGDGMKPVFHAAAALRGRTGNIGVDAARARRLAVVIDLLAATPSLDGQATPAASRRAVVMFDPYIDRPFDFGMAGAQHSDVRAAALAAGRAIHYTDGTFIAHLPPDEARALLARMSDADIATTLMHGSVLALMAARNADWPDLARAARGWPQRRPGETSYDVSECEVLKLAIDGTGDTSRDAAESWAVVDGWLAINQAERCSEGTAGLARRGAAQRADWQVRTRR